MNIHYNRELIPQNNPNHRISKAQVVDVIDSERNRKVEAEKAELKSLYDMRKSFQNRIVDAFDFEEGILNKVEKVTKFVNLSIREKVKSSNEESDTAVSKFIKNNIDKINNIKDYYKENDYSKLDVKKEDIIEMTKEIKRKTDFNLDNIRKLENLDNKIKEIEIEKFEFRNKEIENFEKKKYISDNIDYAHDKSDVIIDNNKEVFNSSKKNEDIFFEKSNERKIEKVLKLETNFKRINNRIELIQDNIKENKIRELNINLKNLRNEIFEINSEKKELEKQIVKNYNGHGKYKQKSNNQDLFSMLL